MLTDGPDSVETIAFAFSVLVVTYVVQDGKSNYLEGAMVSSTSIHPYGQTWILTQLHQLLGLYMIIALAFWASPSGALDNYLALPH